MRCEQHGLTCPRSRHGPGRRSAGQRLPFSARPPWPSRGNGLHLSGRTAIGRRPVTAAADFQFRLFDALTGGNQIGSLLSANAVTPSSGRFTIDLDFGPAFAGRPLPRDSRSHSGRLRQLRHTPPVPNHPAHALRPLALRQSGANGPPRPTWSYRHPGSTRASPVRALPQGVTGSAGPTGAEKDPSAKPPNRRAQPAARAPRTSLPCSCRCPDQPAAKGHQALPAPRGAFPSPRTAPRPSTPPAMFVSAPPRQTQRLKVIGGNATKPALSVLADPNALIELAGRARRRVADGAGRRPPGRPRVSGSPLGDGGEVLLTGGNAALTDSFTGNVGVAGAVLLKGGAGSVSFNPSFGADPAATSPSKAVPVEPSSLPDGRRWNGLAGRRPRRPIDRQGRHQHRHPDHPPHAPPRRPRQLRRSRDPRG